MWGFIWKFSLIAQVSISEFLDEQVYPALFSRLDIAFPEFCWNRQGLHWVATACPPGFGGSPTGKRPDRLMVYENAKYWIKIHGESGVRFLDYLNNGQTPRGTAFIDAARKLAELANVPFPTQSLSAEDEENARKLHARRGALKAVFQHCADELHKTDGAAALEYLQEKRGLSLDAVKDLGLGFYRNVEDVKAVVRNEGFDPSSREDCPGVWKKFEGYITYPWHDAAGHPLTIYGRWPGEPPEGIPKTIALPGAGRKGSPLYFDRARRLGHGDIVLVEGVNDAALLQSLGDARVVACVGAQLSGEQVKTLTRCNVSSVTICLDPDGGGDAGTISCIRSLAASGIRAYVAPRLPEGVDPDEYVLAHGIEGWRDHIAMAEHSLRFMARLIVQKHRGAGWQDLTKDACIVEAAEFIRQNQPDIADLDLHFWPEFAKALDVDVATLKGRCTSTHDEQAEPDALDEIVMPSGYTMSKFGLYYMPEIKGKAKAVEETEEPKPVWVSAPFELLGQVADGNSSDWGIVLRWPDLRGTIHEWTVPRAFLHAESRQIAQALEVQGLRCSINTKLLRDFLMYTKVPRILHSVDTAGWHSGKEGHVYVLADGTVFGGAEHTVILKPEARKSGLECAPSGTLEEWQVNIARYCVKNPRLALFVAAAFTGPLLDPASEPSGGFHLIGKSRSGKSSAMRAAASVWGKSNAKMLTWRGTSNGMEGIAKVSSDGLLLLDEMGQAEDREIGNTIYMLANETGKVRAGRTGEARDRATWRVLFLSTGEVGLEAKMMEANKTAATGLNIRLVDLTADAGRGMGVFEDIHDKKDAATLADHLREASRQYYGTAIREFLEQLSKLRADGSGDLDTLVASFREEFTNAYVPQDADGQVRSVAGRFSLIAAAGELAAAFGVTGWPEGVAKDAAGKCFRIWLTSRGHAGAGEDQKAVAQIRHFLIQHGASRFEDPNGGAGDGESDTPRTIYNRVGWRIPSQSAAGYDYAIPKDMWEKEVCRGVEPQQAARVLKERGLLVRTEDGRLMTKVTIPGQGRPRVYLISGSIVGADDPGQAGGE
jgi:uncharacterized protein (DUF927 family)